MDYESFSNEIPDSDAKIYMSLDDIIKMEGIRKPGPGSVRSTASRRSVRSTYSNRSHRSIYSNRSRRSNYSNKSHRSNYSNKSHRSTYSNRSRQSTYSNRSNRSRFSQNHYDFQQQNRQRFGNGFNNGAFQRRLNTSPRMFRVLKRPGVYVQNNSQMPFYFYKNRVRQAVKTLSGISRQRYQPFRRPGQNAAMFRSQLPSDLTVEVLNRRPPPLTQKSLAMFNKANNGRHSGNASFASSRYSINNNIGQFRRHKIILNKKWQKEIHVLQQQYAKRTNNSSESYENMEFYPTPHVTEVTTNGRFSM